MFVGNCFLLVLNLPLIPFLAQLINLPYTILIPLVVVLSLLGVFLTTFSIFDLGLMIIIATITTFLRLQNYPLAPLLLGFILGGMFEENLRRTALISMGEWGYLLERPTTLFLLGLSVIIWLTPLWHRARH